jgi:hypothetical protein
MPPSGWPFRPSGTGCGPRPSGTGWSASVSSHSGLRAWASSRAGWRMTSTTCLASSPATRLSWRRRRSGAGQVRLGKPSGRTSSRSRGPPTGPRLASGRYVAVKVGDTGTGMSPEVVDRAFEPFYSTKPKGEGSGFGLATVYGIITQAGGSARIYSEPEIGTTVNLLLRPQAAPGGPGPLHVRLHPWPARPSGGPRARSSPSRKALLANVPAREAARRSRAGLTAPPSAVY